MSWLLAVTLGIAGGTLFRSFFVFGWSVYPFLFLLLFVVLVGHVFIPRRTYALATIFFLCALIGMGRTAIADTSPPPAFMSLLNMRASLTGIVVGDPDLRDATQRVPVRVSYAGTYTTVLVVAPRYQELAVGQRVEVRGTLELPQPFASEGGRTFRYDKFLQRDGIRFMLNYASVRVIAPPPWYSLPAFLARVKHAFLSGLNVSLPEPYASLAGGIVIGGKSGLGGDLQNAFVRTGLIQIIVLSGYNVMVVAEWVMAALAYLNLPLRTRALAGALALVIFIGIAGTSATAVRAGIMACIALYARATGKSYAASRALLLAITLMLLWHPLLAAYDPGFGLSVAATAGLIWLAPLFENLLCAWSRLRFLRAFRSNPLLLKEQGDVAALRLLSENATETTAAPATASATSAFWINAIATTLAAQIAVLPLLLYDTGNLSLIAIPANLLVMPLVPASMAFSAVAGIAGVVFGGAAPLAAILAGLPAYLLTSALIWVAVNAASLRLAAFTVPSFSFWFILASYGLLAIYASAANRSSATPQLRLAKNAST